MNLSCFIDLSLNEWIRISLFIIDIYIRSRSIYIYIWSIYLPIGDTIQHKDNFSDKVLCVELDTGQIQCSLQLLRGFKFSQTSGFPYHSQVTNHKVFKKVWLPSLTKNPNSKIFNNKISLHKRLKRQ